MIRFSLLFPVLLLALVGCRSTEPIYESSGVAIPSSLRDVNPQDLTASVLRDPVIASRGWYVQEVMEDRVRAGLMVRQHEAIVDVYFTDGELRPVYVSSVNLEEDDGEIHPAFNTWVQNLERDLRRALANKQGAWSGE